MTPEEKIEALREWLETADYTRLDIDDWKRGFLDAQRGVRDIIDPPKPKWREIADRWSWTALHIPTEQDALASVLYSLGGICAGKIDADWLGKIIAICEAQVGDGWQADPDDLRRQFESSETTGVLFIAEALTNFYEPSNWKVAGNRAAAWLRHILDGGAE